MNLSPVSTPRSTSNFSAHADDSDDADVFATDILSNAHADKRRVVHTGSMCDQRPPVRPGILNGLLRPFAQSRRRRHDHKMTARAHVTLAIQMNRGSEREREESHSHLTLLVSHCKDNHLKIEHEMERALASTKHPLTLLLEAEDYAGLAILAPSLSASDHGSTFVRRVAEGVYVGQGKKLQGGDDEVILAEGRGILMLTNGRRIEGLWHNNKPDRVTCFFPNGPIDYYSGSIVDKRLHGECVTRYRNGDTFSGCWKDGARHGAGTMTMANGATLRASWRKGVMLPGARYETIEGHLYQGNIDIETGKLRGRVSLVWGAGQRCGGRYEGFVEDGKPQGMGRYTFAAGEQLYGFVYDGPWVDGQKHGTGILKKLVDEKKMTCAFLRDVLCQ